MLGNWQVDTFYQKQKSNILMHVRLLLVQVWWESTCSEHSPLYLTISCQWYITMLLGIAPCFRFCKRYTVFFREIKTVEKSFAYIMTISKASSPVFPLKRLRSPSHMWFLNIIVLIQGVETLIPLFSPFLRSLPRRHASLEDVL